MKFDEKRAVLGGLTNAQIAKLDPDVREARIQYLRESGDLIDQCFDQLDVFELPSDHSDKDRWWTEAPGRRRYLSLDEMLDCGWELSDENELTYG